MGRKKTDANIINRQNIKSKDTNTHKSWKSKDWDIIRDQFHTFISDIPHDEYIEIHRKRYILTLDYIHKYLPVPGHILELGPMSLVSRFLTNFGCRIDTVESDLRFPWATDTEKYEAVLSLEVIEHLSDAVMANSPIGTIATFTMSGAQNMFRESHRSLQKNGWLFITTPNANSIDVIGNVLMRRPPFLYPLHVREYTPEELISMAGKFGFDCEYCETFFAWNSQPDIDRDSLMVALTDLGFDMSRRGDDAVYVFRKK